MVRVVWRLLKISGAWVVGVFWHRHRFLVSAGETIPDSTDFRAFLDSSFVCADDGETAAALRALVKPARDEADTEHKYGNDDQKA